MHSPSQGSRRWLIPFVVAIAALAGSGTIVILSTNLARMQASGAALDYATYLGGRAVDEAWGCSVDRWDNAYVIGRTKSSDFPTVNSVQPAPGGRGDAVIVKLGP